MRKWGWFFLCGLLALSGCRSNGRQISADFDEDYYHDYMTPDTMITSLNYLVDNSENSARLYGNLVDGLVETDRYGNLKSALAQDIGVPNDDASTWDFMIREGVSWVNYQGEQTGENVKADDFVYAIEYVLDANNHSAYRNQVAGLLKNGAAYVNGEVDFDEVGVKAVNDYTVRYTLEKPCVYFNTYLLNGGFYPVSRNLVAQSAERFAQSPEYLWYNGAYFLTGFSDKNITYSKNEYYWDVSQTTFNGGSIVQVEDDDEALEMFRKGDLSYAYVSDSYASDHGSEIDTHLFADADNDASYFYIFNFDSENENVKKALDNENFRKALFYGLDTRNVLGVKKANGEDEISNLDTSAKSTLIPSGFATNNRGTDYLMLGSLSQYTTSPNYNSDKQVEYQGKAMAELADTVTFPLEIRVPVQADNQRSLANFSSVFSNFDPNFVSFKAVSYHLDNHDQSEDSVSFDKLLKDNDYDLILTSIYASCGDPSTYLDKLQSDGYVNRMYGHFQDEIYDSLCAAASQMTDLDSRLQAYAECESYLLSKAYIIPFSHGYQRYKVTSINDYTRLQGSYGLAKFKLKGVSATNQAVTINERQAFKAAYEEAKSTGV